MPTVVRLLDMHRFRTTWTRLDTSGLGPSERSSPAVADIGSSLYVFGGVRDDFASGVDTFYQDL